MVLKKLVLGWILICGMVVYSLALGAQNVYHRLR